MQAEAKRNPVCHTPLMNDPRDCTVTLTLMSNNEMKMISEYCLGNTTTGADDHSKNSFFSAVSGDHGRPGVLEIVETSSVDPIDSPLASSSDGDDVDVGLVVGEDGFCGSNSVFDSDLSETASESSQEQAEGVFRERGDVGKVEEIEHIVELEQTLMLELTRQQSSFMEDDGESANLNKERQQVEKDDRIRELEAQKARLAEDLQKRTSELRAVQSERDSLQQQVEEHQELIDEMAEEVDSVLASLDEAENVNETQAEQIRLLEEQLETQKLETSSRNRDKSENPNLSRLEQVEETVRLQADKILSYEDQLELIGKERDAVTLELENSEKSRKKQITILKDQVELLEGQVRDRANSDEQTSVLEKKLESQSLDIATLEKEMRRQRESLEQQVGAVMLELKQAQSTNASQSKQIEALGVELDKRKRDAHVQLTESANKSRRMSKLEGQNEELLAAMSELLHRSLPRVDADTSELNRKEQRWIIGETECSEDSDSSVASDQLLSSDFSAWGE